MTDVSAHTESFIDALGSSFTNDLFQILRDGRPRTRTELSAMTGLARSTVALRVEALMRLGLVGSVGDAVSTGGRPSSQFAITASERAVLAVDIGASHVRIAISDLTGKTQGENAAALEVAEGPEVVLGWVVESATRLLSELGRKPSDILAIGVGLPGPVEHSSGRPPNPPIMPGWDRFDVPSWFGATFDA